MTQDNTTPEGLVFDSEAAAELERLQAHLQEGVEIEAVSEVHPPQDSTFADEPMLSSIILDLVKRVKGWTDIHVAPGKPVMMRRAANNWSVAPAPDGESPIYVSASQITAFLNGVYNSTEVPVLTDAGNKVFKPAWVEDLDKFHSLHPAHFIGEATDGGGLLYARLRIAVQKQNMGEDIVMVIRHLPDVPNDTRSLGLPIQVGQMCQAPNGLLIVTGPTGAGKSTTIAGMISEINRSRSANVQTIEDPIEYVYERDRSIINQREVGVDVATFADGVRDALRFVPDVIVIGEIRDQGTARAALRAGESGHLLIASMHAPTVFGAIRSLLAMLPGEAEAIALGNSIVGVIAQALVPGKDPQAGEKHLAYEVLYNVDRTLRDAISSRNAAKLSEVEKQFASSDLGQSSIWMGSTLLRLAREGKVLPAVAASLCQDHVKRSEILKLTQGEGR